MKRIFLLLAGILFTAHLLFAQEQNDESGTKGFNKENFFVGGSISAAISSGIFGIGGNPEFGYSLTKWADFGIVGNYNYTSYREFRGSNRLHQTIYGGGVYTRLFPVKFLFAQAQMEHNWIVQKELFAGGASDKTNLSSNSLLVGVGYTTGRNPMSKSGYGYLAILFDVLGEGNSPYVGYDYDVNGNISHYSIPVIRAGYIFPLFQGHKSR
jgi:hypothetical protein